MQPPAEVVIEGLFSAERALHAAILASDLETLDRLLDQQAVFTGADGAVIDKAADLQAHRSGALDVTVYEVIELTGRIIGDTAVTFVLADVAGHAGGRPFEVRLRYTRTWSLTPEGWRVVAAHASSTGRTSNA